MVNVLSLFDGISCGMVALKKLGISVGKYYASEIDWYPRQISEGNFPEIISLGSVTNYKLWDKASEIDATEPPLRNYHLSLVADSMIKGKRKLTLDEGGIPWQNWNLDWSSIDLVFAGFPCQSWSMAGQQLGDKDPRGALFWTTLEIIKKVLTHNPNGKFLMENVKMKKEFEDYITHHTEQALGYVEKTLINSALVSAQNRNRFYWTNFKVSQPEDVGVLLRDIVEDSEGIFQKPRGFNKGGIVFDGKKAPTITSMSWEHNNFTCFKISGGALRGRYLKNGVRQDHKMKVAGLTEQRLEIRSDDKTNTLTTVQKDNVIVYRPCELLDKPTKGGHVANATDIKGNDSIRRVHSVDGKAPTLTTMAGGHREPKILVNVNPSGKGMNGNVCNVNSSKSPTLTTNKGEGIKIGVRATVQKNAEHCFDGKVPTLTASMGMGGGNVPLWSDANTVKSHKGKYIDKNERLFYRKLTPIECERLQTLPDNYTKFVSNSQRYKAIGNGWTVNVIAHILQHVFN